MQHRQPLDTVVFEAGALLDAAPNTPRPGARRLVAALARGGVAVAVATDEPTEPADRARRRLTDAGLPAQLVVGSAGHLADRLRPDPARALLVRSASASRAGADPLAALPTVTCGDDAGPPVHRAVHAWLAEAVGPLAASSLLWAPPDAEATTAAERRHLQLTKPPGSLGRLEAIGIQLAGIAAQVPPPVPRPAAVAVFAGDHGVHRQGVSPWPQEVTAQMVANFLAGGAAINVLARHAGAEVVVVDVGVAADLTALAPPDSDVVAPPPGRPLATADPGRQPGDADAGGTGPVPAGAALQPGAGTGDSRPRLLHRKVRPGTADLSAGPAMTPDEARRALEVGAQVAADLVARGARCLVTGDMGIANTTPSSALIAALADRPAPAVTGHGAGLDAELLAHKAAVVEAAAARARAEHGDDPLAVLAEVGGLEHAALAGYVIAGAALQVPVVVDGVIAAAALLVAARLVPGVERAVIAGHRSVEPGSAAVLGALGLDPMVDLGLRLGEGTGAALALPLVEAAALVLDEMATFDQAGVSDKGA